MKHRIRRRKLNNTKGASVIFALFGLMISAMVSFVVVSAAWMNANRVRDLKEDEQAYLTASSYANLIVEAIADPDLQKEVATDFVMKYQTAEVTDPDTGVITVYYNPDFSYASGYTPDTVPPTVFTTTASTYIDPTDSVKGNVDLAHKGVCSAVAGLVSNSLGAVPGDGYWKSEFASEELQASYKIRADIEYRMYPDYHLEIIVKGYDSKGSQPRNTIKITAYPSIRKDIQIAEISLDGGVTTTTQKVITNKLSWPADQISAVGQ